MSTVIKLSKVKNKLFAPQDHKISDRVNLRVLITEDLRKAFRGHYLC